MKRNLVYLCDGISSVFDSQVLALLVRLYSLNYFKNIYLIIGLKNSSELNDLKKRKIPEYLNVLTYKSFPNYSVFNKSKEISLKKV
ncbi:hypothetical protein ACFLTH_10500, partial [Bacteroidota bacterium]